MARKEERRVERVGVVGVRVGVGGGVKARVRTRELVVEAWEKTVGAECRDGSCGSRGERDDEAMLGGGM
jgi:hypothetical protein